MIQHTTTNNHQHKSHRDKRRTVRISIRRRPTTDSMETLLIDGRNEKEYTMESDERDTGVATTSTTTREDHPDDDDDDDKAIHRSSSPASRRRSGSRQSSSTTTTMVETRFHKLPMGDSNPHVFVEYVRPNHHNNTYTNEEEDEGQGGSSTTIQALAVLIDPQGCSRIVKALSHCLPLPRQLQHLKRVKRFIPPTHSPPTKRTKIILEEEKNHEPTSHGPSPPQLQLLLGLAPLSTLLESFHLDASGEGRGGPSVEAESNLPSVEQLLLTILHQGDTITPTATATTTEAEQPSSIPYHQISVPRRPPQSQDEAREANQLWPTHFFPLQSLEQQQRKWALSLQEMTVMVKRIHGLSTTKGEAWVADPSCNLIVATSGEEEAAQEEEEGGGGGGGTKNPLATPVLFAIQGVSRLERQQQGQNHNNSSSSSQRHPHYLCSGYDIYCNYEPCVFESMALVHSRFGRVVWCNVTPSPPGSVWKQGLSKHTIHCLPGTNHHFRAFEYKKKGLTSD